MRAPPDGYTLLAVGSNNMINATLYEKLNFDFIRDIALVASIYRVPQVMEVNPSRERTALHGAGLGGCPLAISYLPTAT